MSLVCPCYTWSIHIVNQAELKFIKVESFFFYHSLIKLLWNYLTFMMKQAKYSKHLVRWSAIFNEMHHHCCSHHRVIPSLAFARLLLLFLPPYSTARTSESWGPLVRDLESSLRVFLLLVPCVVRFVWGVIWWPHYSFYGRKKFPNHIKKLSLPVLLASLRGCIHPLQF